MTLLTPTDRAFKAKQQVVHDVLVELQSNKHGVVDIGLLRDAFREREEVDFSTYFPERNNRKRKDRHWFKHTMMESRRTAGAQAARADLRSSIGAQAAAAIAATDPEID